MTPDLVLFVGGPWDGEVRRMFTHPSIYVKAGGEYRLSTATKSEPAYIFHEDRATSRGA